MTITAPPQLDVKTLNRICDRAFAQMVYMIWHANHRPGGKPGDPKVGGHPAACGSSCHILGALHLVVREVGDFVCCKPHASPMDHAFHHHLRLFGREDGTWFNAEQAKRAMHGLREFPDDGDFHSIFQSYHARSDADSFHFLPSGSVGIPPVASVYLALAYRYMEDHGRDIPKAHFWSLIGDSEFREGSLLEAMPDVAERQLGNVTWIIDYNRQNLDGTRMPNEKGLTSRDCDRIENTALANGWRVIQLRHGAFREEVFAQPGGEHLRVLFEEVLTDAEYQLAIYKRDAAFMRQLVKERFRKAATPLGKLQDDQVLRLFEDVGGHDLRKVIDALEQAKEEPEKPYVVIAHTIKGWDMGCFAHPANHNSLPEKSEVAEMLGARGLSLDDPFATFDEDSDEACYLAERSEVFRAGISSSRADRVRRRTEARQAVIDAGGVPVSLDIDLAMFPTAHTQWMWGQLAAKIVRISTAGEAQPDDARIQDRPLDEIEQRWAPVSKFVMTMSPDVGTSTNIAPVLDKRIYGARDAADQEDYDARHPELASGTDPWTRHIRFEIAEANCMSAAGSFGRMAHYTGHPCFPIMTVYDFFIKRALDQLFYNLYWGAEFVIIGTPSGVTLSPEGAQHSWKSDIQIPNLITWEPAFAIEMDWILSDAIRRHMMDENEGRRGILIRAVTRAISQKLLLESLRRHARNKTGLGETALLKPAGADESWGEAIDESAAPAQPNATLLAHLREDVLSGAYYLVDWRGYAGYEPGDNVVNLFTMGSLVVEAQEAAMALIERGVFANVIAITSPELLLGILGEADGYSHLRENLALTGDLYLTEGEALNEAGLVAVAGRRVPAVAICDGEAGLLDNIGSILGVKQVTLAVRKFSKCGRPDQVFRFQELDADSIVDAAGRVLAETAMENVHVSRRVLEAASGRPPEARRDWRQLWPDQPGK
ncbi:MAG: pyruvate dehydrogenase [Planctomycetota bacterium]|nr:pyruvate dehydrogenase [Planctomycetota bacterium]